MFTDQEQSYRSEEMCSMNYLKMTRKCNSQNSKLLPIVSDITIRVLAQVQIFIYGQPSFLQPQCGDNITMLLSSALKPLRDPFNPAAYLCGENM